MHAAEDMPLVDSQASMADAISEMSSKRLGMVGDNRRLRSLVGIFTDGDLRRTLGQRVDIHASIVADVMRSSPQKTISPTALAAEALQLMQSHSINGLFAVDATGALSAPSMHWI